MQLKWNFPSTIRRYRISDESGQLHGDFSTDATMLAQSRFLQFFLTAAAGRGRFGAVLVQGLAWVLAALVLGWVVAGWFWEVVAPKATPGLEPAVAELDYQTAAKAIVTRHLLGKASSDGDEGQPDEASVHFRLMGVMTSTPKAAGFAILTEEGKPSVAVVEGETFAPGVTLVEILPGRVRLRIGERVETIEMKERTEPLTTPTVGATAEENFGKTRSSPPEANRPRPGERRP
jgi:hypothetical protein